MRSKPLLAVPGLALALALSGCGPDAEALDCAVIDEVVAAYDAADADVPAPVEAADDPTAQLPHYTGLQALGIATEDAATDALDAVRDPERVAALEAVVDAAGDLAATSEQAIATVQDGGDPLQIGGPEALPGYVNLELTGAMGGLRLDSCHVR